MAKRKEGKPTAKPERQMVNVRMPIEMKTRLDSRAEHERRTVSEVVLYAISKYLETKSDA